MALTEFACRTFTTSYLHTCALSQQELHTLCQEAMAIDAVV